MKVQLLLASKPEIGGGFQYSRCVLDSLLSDEAKRHGVELSVVALDPAWRNHLDGRIASECIYYVSVSQFAQSVRGFCIRTGALSLWQLVRWLLSPLTRHLEKTAPDLVLTPCQSFLCVDSPFAVIAPIHDLMYCYETLFPEVTGTYARRRRAVDKAVVSQCSGILVDSLVGSAHVLSQFNCLANRVKVLPFCGNSPGCDSGNNGSAPSKGVPQRFIFYPAQFWSHKNHQALVSAVDILRSQGLEVHCVLCGSEKNAGIQLRERVKVLGLENQIHFLGFVSDDGLRWLYRHAVAMVMPSFFGPTNIPPLEAMENGCPVAVADVYGMREQLGNAALFFNPKCPSEIGEVMRILWEDSEARDKLIKNGHKRSQMLAHSEFTKRLIRIIFEVGSGDTRVT